MANGSKVLKKACSVLCNFALLVWQLPQVLVGASVWLYLYFLKKNKPEKGGVGVWYWSLFSGVSLSGWFIFINARAYVSTLKHERGHAKQSLMLGWLYLLVIGIPSFAWAAARRYGFFIDRSYYSFYTEKWADKLGGVDRSDWD